MFNRYIIYFYGSFSIASELPSGKRLHNYGKSPFSTGKSTINGPFSIAMWLFTRIVYRNWLVVSNMIFIVHTIWDNPSHWLISFKMVKTTNQLWNVINVTATGDEQRASLGLCQAAMVVMTYGEMLCIIFYIQYIIHDIYIIHHKYIYI